MGARHTAQGFTLIEVLVAFMILALSLSVLFRIFSGGLNNVAVAGDYAQAVLVAESQLAVVSRSEPLVAGQTYGESGERFRWRRIIEDYMPWEDEAALPAPWALGVVAKGLLTEPRVLLLDEPTRGIDVNAKREIYGLIDELKRQGLAMVVVSSELPELLGIADRIMVMCEGRKTAEFARGQASEEQILKAALPRTM